MQSNLVFVLEFFARRFSWSATVIAFAVWGFSQSILVAQNAVSLPQSKSPSVTPLNVVFVLCDDHRYDCLGIEGHPFLETPHLDQLARDGAIMSKAYVTTSLCSPSRTRF